MATKTLFQFARYKKIGCPSQITSDSSVASNADKLMLSRGRPFDYKILKLKEFGLLDVLNDKVLQEKTPILGIVIFIHIIVSIDVKKRRLFGSYQVVSLSGKKRRSIFPVGVAIEAVKQGAGELLITSVASDGLMSGYDVELIKSVSEVVSVSVIVCGGAGSFLFLRGCIKRY